MAQKKPTIFQMARAPFLSSILSPLIGGTLLAVTITGSFNFPGFIFVIIMGIGLHIATNVYNDIYDTKQGTDKINVHRNEFSGGSGILQDFPEYMPRMYALARSGLVIALIATVALTFVVNKSLLVHLWILYILSAFFSKYYTAAPIKLAYRGLGEISVWFAFGPMAILVAAVSQNVGLHHLIVAAMPATGISTLSILLIGQLIDYDADKQAGKWGVAVRIGTKFTAILYMIVQIILVIDIIVLVIMMLPNGWTLLLALIPYIFFFPRAARIVIDYHDQPNELKKAAGINVQIHLLFAVLFSIGIGLNILLTP